MPAVPQTLPPSICRGASLPSAVLPGKSQVFLLRWGPPEQNCTPSRLCSRVRTRVAPTVGQKDWLLKPARTVGLSFPPFPVPPPLNQPHLPTLLWMEFFLRSEKHTKVRAMGCVALGFCGHHRCTGEPSDSGGTGCQMGVL